ncbi:MAG: purine-binding chemotaxis protein CheW [Bdellovibrionaceae bacterium]|nr:purine-binding chemotaxis protein CheW [Pseudobdellovibrionaceae bacterium]
MNLGIARPGQYLTFKLKNEFYGVAIENVREINRVGEITPVPKTPQFIKGVMNLRGKIIPVVNLRERFGLNSEAYTRDTCIIVIDTPQNQIGLIVDSVKEVMTLEDRHIEASPALAGNKTTNFIVGLGKYDDKVIILVDIVSVFTPEQIGNWDNAHRTKTEAA